MYHRTVAAAVVCLGMAHFGSSVSAQSSDGTTSRYPVVSASVPAGTAGHDVVLRQATLRGRVVDRGGKPVSGARVVLSGRANVVGSTNCDQLGRFRFDGVKTGTWVLHTSQTALVVRAWQPEIAPPSATAELMLVSATDLVRGQCAGPGCAGCDQCSAAYDGHFAYRGHFGGAFQRILRNPWLAGAGTAAAIAIPLATDDDDDDGDQLRSSESAGDADAS